MTGHAAPLGEMNEDELLTRARTAGARAVAAGRGTLGWSVQWAVYDNVMDELHRRALGWVASAPPEALRELQAWLAIAGPRARGDR